MGMGDEIMVTAQARILQRTDPRKVIVLDKNDHSRGHAMWIRNPRIARPGEEGDFQGLKSCPGHRPYIQDKGIANWQWKSWDTKWLAEGAGIPHGEIYLSPVEQAFGDAHSGRVVIEPNLKAGASPNKNWGWENWETLVRLMVKRGYTPTQLGPKHTRLIKGAEFIETPDFRYGCAVIKRAEIAVLHEGGLHHAAAAFGVRAVVIFGGYISPAQTGYAIHDNLFEGEKGCGSRMPCHHCKKIMGRFSPEVVFGRFLTMKENGNGTN